MNPLELLEMSTKTSTVAFHKFVLLCNGRKNDLFCFFEGADSQYYSMRIKQFVEKNYHPISCGNKKTVLETFHLLDNNTNYIDYPKAFFVDKDFDEPINDTKLYETLGYSVENFYVNKITFSEILKNEFKLTEADKEFQSLSNLFEEELNKFSWESLYFNAWYCALQKKKRENKLKTTGVNLDEKIPKDLFCLKIGSISSNCTFEKIKEAFPSAIEISKEDVDKAISELKSQDITLKLRGKYQMWFFYTFLQFLIADANSKKTLIKEKTKFNVDRANIYSQLSHYALTPECLKTYLRKFN